MRKKELLMLYEQAYEKLSKLTVYLEEIKAENETLKAKISVLEKRCRDNPLPQPKKKHLSPHRSPHKKKSDFHM